MRLRLLLPVIAALAATPAAAQFTDGYNFIKAVKDRDGAKATEFLDKNGVSIVNVRDNDTGDAAIHIVARRSDDVWLGFLFGKGANLNLKDREGFTPLMIAVRTGWSEGVRLMLQLKAQPDLQNRIGDTALALAVQKRDATIARQLLDAGANPDITDNSGASARSQALADPRAAAIAKLMKDVAVKKPRPVQGPSL
ncbi:hypothetical protein IP88_15400 [alpha proteobacterium AAP81b]|nr:hypothetical protein IP88_15400 [alpha proteobacterium AAP81b]